MRSCRSATARSSDAEELQIDLMREISGTGDVALRVSRAGALHAVTIKVGEDRRSLTEPGRLLPGLGFDLATWNADTSVQSAPPASAGARAGFRPGDRILSVDGAAIANSSDFIAAVSGSADKDLAVDVLRGGQTVRILAHVPRVVEQGHPIGRLGITLAEGHRTWPAGMVSVRRFGPLEALGEGVKKTWEMSSMTVQMLLRIVTGQVSAKNISGPISIAEFAGISAYLGASAFIAFLAIISVSLGVLNLMPVPLLDGGQVLYQLAEAVKGSPLSERAQNLGQQVGIALLVVLMSLAFYNDISRHLN